MIINIINYRRVCLYLNIYSIFVESRPSVSVYWMRQKVPIYRGVCMRTTARMHTSVRAPLPARNERNQAGNRAEKQVVIFLSKFVLSLEFFFCFFNFQTKQYHPNKERKHRRHIYYTNVIRVPVLSDCCVVHSDILGTLLTKRGMSNWTHPVAIQLGKYAVLETGFQVLEQVILLTQAIFNLI